MLPKTKFMVGDKVMVADHVKWVRTFTCADNHEYTRIPASALKGCIGRVDHTYGKRITGRHCYAVNFTKTDKGRTTPLYLKFYSYQLKLVSYGAPHKKAIEEHNQMLAQNLKKEIGSHFKTGPWVKPEQPEPKKTIEVSLTEARGWYWLGGKLKEMALKLFPATQLNPQPLKRVRVGDMVTVAGRDAYVLELSETGRPIAWVSRVNCSQFLKEGHNWCSKEYARIYALSNGWHVPAQREIISFKGEIQKCLHETIFWTTEQINGDCEPVSWCWWGDPNNGVGYERRPMIVMRYA